MNKIVLTEELSCTTPTPGLDKISQEIGEESFKDNIRLNGDILKEIVHEKLYKNKTECRDEETCVALNEFLDHGYKPQDSLTFALDVNLKYINLTLDTSPLGARDRIDLTHRIMKFIANEMEKIKNGD